MSELKEHLFVPYSELREGDELTDAFTIAKSYYLKSEADKVIAKLKETLNNSRNARKYWRKEYLIEYKECSYQKYKRCLAMAKWCFTKSNYHFVLARHGEDAKKNSRKSELYAKWHKRWLELAEMFK